MARVPRTFLSGLRSQHNKKRERERKKKKEGYPCPHGISHSPPYATAQSRYRRRRRPARSPRKVISLKNVISVRRDGVEGKKSLGVAEFFFPWSGAAGWRRVARGCPPVRSGAARLGSHPRPRAPPRRRGSLLFSFSLLIKSSGWTSREWSAARSNSAVGRIEPRLRRAAL